MSCFFVCSRGSVICGLRWVQAWLTRILLPGNALRTGFIEEPCYNLVYLELAACRLTTLPSNLATLAPNLRVLNLNYNFIDDARPLEGLTRLKKLTLIGSRLPGTKPLIRILERMTDVEMLDFRLGFSIYVAFSAYFWASLSASYPAG